MRETEPAPSPDVMMAKFLALGVRNGVEDLHAEGAFGDDLAPAFNRLVRRRIYEALYALTHVDADTPALRDYLLELVGNEIDADAPLRALLPGAVTNVTYEFANSAGIAEETADALVDAGLAGLLEHLELFDRLGTVGDADEHTQEMAALAFAMIPSYWEDPELSPEFREILVRDGTEGSTQ